MKSDSKNFLQISPAIPVAGLEQFVDTFGIAAFPTGDLRGGVINLRCDANAIWSAPSYALHGY